MMANTNEIDERSCTMEIGIIEIDCGFLYFMTMTAVLVLRVGIAIVDLSCVDDTINACAISDVLITERVCCILHCGIRHHCYCHDVWCS